MAYSATADTLDDLMRHIVEAILECGEENTASRGETLELIAATLELTNPRARISRTETRRKLVSALGELCWYLRGTNDAEMILYYIREYEKDVEPDGTIYGGYGPRIFGHGEDAQVTNVIELLRRKPASRRAVIQIYDRSDIVPGQDHLDIPCTSTIQFLLRSNSLHAVVNMRSNDAFWGFPHDVFAFTMLQELVARELSVEVGRYIHTVGSLHLYEKRIQSARDFLSEGWQSTLDFMPAMPIGSQSDNIAAFLRAEEQLRNGVQIIDVDFPTDPYWGDLTRVLAMHAVRKFSMDSNARDLVISGFAHRAFSEFL